MPMLLFFRFGDTYRSAVHVLSNRMLEMVVSEIGEAMAGELFLSMDQYLAYLPIVTR